MSTDDDVTLAQNLANVEAAASGVEANVIVNDFNDDIFQEVQFIQNESLAKYNIELDPNLIFNRLEECRGDRDRVQLVLEGFRPFVPEAKVENNNVPVVDLSDEDNFFDAYSPNECSAETQAFLMNEIDQNNERIGRKRRLSNGIKEEEHFSPKKIQTDEADLQKPGPSNFQQPVAQLFSETPGPSGFQQQLPPINLENPGPSTLQPCMYAVPINPATPLTAILQQGAPIDSGNFRLNGLQHLAQQVANLEKCLQQQASTNPENDEGVYGIQEHPLDLVIGFQGLQPQFAPINEEKAGRSNLHFPKDLEKAGPSGLQQGRPPIDEERAGHLQNELNQLLAFLDEKIPEPSTNDQVPTTPTEEVAPTQANRLDLPDIINTLSESLPDADIEYLTFLATEFVNPMDLNNEVERLLESKNYPKKKDKIENERMKGIREYYTEKQFTPDDIAKWHDEPLVYYEDTKRPVTESYKQHAIMQTYLDFPKLAATFIKSTLSNYNYHYYPTFRHLREFDNNPRTPARYKRKTSRKSEPLPQSADEEFYKELAFTKISDEYIFVIVQKNERRELLLQQAQLDNDWVECQCCYEDQVLFEESEQCIEGVHMFCRNCVRKLAEEAAVNNSSELKCVAPDCKSKFSLETIQRVLKAIVYEKWLQRCQAEEIKKANLEDFVTCPFCDYGAIIENPEDKVFRCMNPTCRKESCRLCKEDNHIPLRCNEVEKSNERIARTFVEEEMANALIRTCPKCQIKFVKEVIGCNKMTCKCGQAMCYLCRQPIKDYNHFGPDKCPLYVDTVQLHEREVNTRGEQAKQIQKENEMPKENEIGNVM